MSKISKTIILLFLISFVPRIILLGVVMAKNNGNASCLICTDADRYYNKAISLSGKNGAHLSSYESTAESLPWDPPLYSLFLSVFFKLFNPSPLLAGFLNILLFVMCVFSLYKIGEILFGEQAAFIAAAIFSFYPSLLIFNLLVIIEPLFTFLILTGVYFFLLYLKREKLLFLILSTVSLGLSNLVREAVFFLPLVMLILILFKHIKQPKAALRAISLVIVVYIMTLAPLSIYNYNKFGSYWLSGKMRTYFSFQYFDFLPQQKPIPVPSESIEGSKSKVTLKINFSPIKRYFVRRKQFFGGTGTLTMLRVFGYDIANDDTYSMMWKVTKPAEFLIFIRQKAGIGWVIYQCLAWIFIVSVYITSFAALLILFLRKKLVESTLIILMIAYFLFVYYYLRSSRYFYSLTPFLSLLSGYFIASFGRVKVARLD